MGQYYWLLDLRRMYKRLEVGERCDKSQRLANQNDKKLLVVSILAKLQDLGV